MTKVAGQRYWVKFRRLLERERNYKYDPNEFHGPTLPYHFTLPGAGLSGSSRSSTPSTEGDVSARDRRRFRRGPHPFAVIVDYPESWATGRNALETPRTLRLFRRPVVYYSRDYIHKKHC